MDKNQGIIALSAVVIVAGLGLLFVMFDNDTAIAGQAVRTGISTEMRTISTTNLPVIESRVDCPEGQYYAYHEDRCVDAPLSMTISGQNDVSCSDLASESYLTYVVAAAANEMSDGTTTVLNTYYTDFQSKDCKCEFESPVISLLPNIQSTIESNLQDKIDDLNEALDTGVITQEQYDEVQPVFSNLLTYIGVAVSNIDSYMDASLAKCPTEDDPNGDIPGDSSTQPTCQETLASIDGSYGSDYASLASQLTNIKNSQRCQCSDIEAWMNSNPTSSNIVNWEAWYNKNCVDDSTCEEGDDCTMVFTDYCALKVSAADLCDEFCPVPCIKVVDSGSDPNNLDGKYTCIY